MFRTLLISIFLLLALSCTSAQPTSPIASQDNSPRYGGTFNVPVGADPTDYDMSYGGTDGTNGNFIKVGYSSLLRLKTGQDIGYSVGVAEPALAESWEVSPDAKSYTFHLRKAVKYANVPPVNGREINVTDVKFSYEYLSRTGAFKDAKLPASRFQFMFEGLDGVQTPDPNTVVVRFKESFAPFINYAASSDNVIMPQEIYAQDGHFKDKLVGTGPFQPDFAASQKGSSWTLKKNPTYFEQGKPYLDEIRLLVIKDEATQQAAFRAKQIHYVGTTDFRSADEIRLNNPGAAEVSWGTTPYRFDLNFKRPPLNDMRVRKAISLGVDRDEMVKVLQGGRGGWALSASNIRNDLFTQDEIKSFIKYDPEEAKRLLAQAGFAQGLQVEIITGSTAAATKPVELVQAQLKKVGVDLVIKPLDAAEAFLRRQKRDLDISWLSEASRSDIDGSLFLMVSPAGDFNYANIDDAKVNTLLAAQRTEANPDKRRELLRELLRYMNESGILISTVRSNQFIFMQPAVKGWYHQADYRTVGSLWNTWLAQ